MYHNYAEVVVNAPLDKTLHYKVPDTLVPELRIGSRVRVPLGHRLVNGYCVGFPDAPVAMELKEIKEVLDHQPLLGEKMLRLTREIARYYRCTWGEAMEAALPAAVKGERKSARGGALQTLKALRLTKDRVLILEALEGLRKKAPRQARALEVLLESNNGIPLKELSRQSGCNLGGLNSLSSKGLVEIYEQPECRDRPSGLSISESQRPKPELTSEQGQALSLIKTQFSLCRGDRPVAPTVLLQGVTGSGKTEVYLRAIEEVLALGRGAIVLVPEISLTPQAIERYGGRFGNIIAVLHSHLTGAERYDQWQAIRGGKARVVIGARSAVFAPVENLGLIVVDEEHEVTYKQETSPRYHAREVALMRAREEGAVVILGSATPSLETYFNALMGRYQRAILSQRIGQRPLPRVEIVDMKEGFHEGRHTRLISRRLELYMKECLSKGEQALLFLNRRGFSPFVSCPRCGYVLRCKRCDIPLTYHKRQHSTICHYCFYEVKPQENCPECAGARLNYFGLGTERIEEEMGRYFPGYKALRMDSDSMKGRNAHAKALKSFERGEVQILVGTQMIAKGLDLPNVTLVGVISADTILNLPDFRAVERTFQLLAQVAGRAGRGPKGGRVVVQTFNPRQYAILAAAAHDYEGFADRELEYRRELGYPPFGYMARIVLVGQKEERVKDRAQKLAEALRQVASIPGGLLTKVTTPGVEVVGPAPAPIPRIKNQFRWQLSLRSPHSEAIKELLEGIPGGTTGGVRITIDIDPYSML
ncbi:MAG TPA: replication restart helicase PriA [Candidatus Tripitaka californicus]|uniref:replication restart helicase PriA n=1 Tax=Candidatus Tripitaka californicus TaxID=3367616 RepID=UPI004025FF76|nr:primosomal protein N' [Planctomycetota bacterium]